MTIICRFQISFSDSGYYTLISRCICCSFFFVLLMLFSSSAFSKLKNDFWVPVDNSELKYTQVKGGMLLKNDCRCEINNIEVQTYPSASNAASRIFGFGSYYYKVESIKEGDSVQLHWNKFSNTSGKYLNLDEYSFNRISISGKKQVGKKEKSISEHFHCDPRFTMEKRGFPITVKNICHHPIRLAVHYKNTSGSWVTDSWWKFDPSGAGTLVTNKQSILTNDSRLYYYAETTNGASIVWTDDKISYYIGFKKYGMRAFDDFDGDTYLELNCNNSK